MEEINKIIKELWQKTYRGTGTLEVMLPTSIAHDVVQTLISLRYLRRPTMLQMQQSPENGHTTIGL
eukprot:m.176027 g.176027  ORF g.176027 m.176027 type:complete len:66 (-) comp16793_c0_seq4:59-256(-)